MFDSPLHFCPIYKQYVELDQSQHQCARLHGCVPAHHCPLAGLFRPPAPDAPAPADGDSGGKPDRGD